MKRTLLQRGAIIAACAAAFVLGGCGDTEFDSRTDTVYSLETPQVTARAYPGVNIVSWAPVTSATGYKVYVYEEGAFKREVNSNDSNLDGNSYIDKTLTNGKTYTYYVEAKSDSDPAAASAREVFAKGSRGEASARAIVPPAGTSVLLLPAFEGGYDGNGINIEDAEKKIKDDKFVVSADNIKVTTDKGNAYVNIPTKAYLSYKVTAYSYDTDTLDEIEIGDDPSTTLSDVNSNNVTLTKSFPITSSGKYKVVVAVSSKNSIYTADKVTAGEIEIKTLDLNNGTGTVTASYLSDGKTARISFEPAKKDGVYVGTDWYKVYRHVQGDYALTAVTAKIEEEISVTTVNDKKTTKKTYYVDDPIDNTKQVYKYIVVVTDGTKYGTAKKASLDIVTDLSLNSETDTVTAEYLYDVNHFAADADNTVRISFAPAKKDGEVVTTDKYKVYRAEVTEYDTRNKKVVSTDLVQTEITSDTNKIMLDKEDPNAYVVYDKTDIDPAKYYVYTVVVTYDKNSSVATGVLNANTKSSFTINVGNPSVEGNPGSLIDDVYNDIEWNFTVGKTAFDVKNITVYLLTTSDAQIAPKTNEVIAKGTKLEYTKVKDSSTDYTASKKGLPVGYAYVVVTAECDGYDKAISNVSTTPIEKD